MTIPKADPSWHPIAKRWYAALDKSGQSQFYTEGDWLTGYVAADAISRELANPGPITGAVFAQFLKACTLLLVCEGDRRRAGLELEREGPKPSTGGGGEGTDNGEVAWLEARRRRTG